MVPFKFSLFSGFPFSDSGNLTWSDWKIGLETWLYLRPPTLSAVQVFWRGLEYKWTVAHSKTLLTRVFYDYWLRSSILLYYRKLNCTFILRWGWDKLEIECDGIGGTGLGNSENKIQKYTSVKNTSQSKSVMGLLGQACDEEIMVGRLWRLARSLCLQRLLRAVKNGHQSEAENTKYKIHPSQRVWRLSVLSVLATWDLW